MKAVRINLGNHFTYLSLIFLLLLFSTGNIRAQSQRNLRECSQIEDDGERLKCYDEVVGRDLKKTETVVDESCKAPEEPAADASYLSQMWELDKARQRNRYSIMLHRATYILPVSYNRSPNKEPIQEASPGEDVRNTEVKFQLSLKVKLWQDILDREMDLWFGYTQQSFWQVYNFDDSAPFRETDYEPELLLNYRTNFNLLGMNGRTITIGLNHQSNGRSEPLSRSWNRVVGNFGFERKHFILLLNTWYRIPAQEEDDNPDIDEYMGPGEIWGYYLWNNHRFGMMLRNNFQVHDNRGALQLEWSFPLIERVSGYIQYFNGYGESLLDYNHSVNRMGIGVILKNPFNHETHDVHEK